MKKNFNNFEFRKEVGYRLEAYRNAKKINIQAMADFLGISKNSYYKLRKGEFSVNDYILSFMLENGILDNDELARKDEQYLPMLFGQFPDKQEKESRRIIKQLIELMSQLINVLNSKK